MSKKNPSLFEEIIVQLQAFFVGPNLPDVLSGFDIKFLFNIFRRMSRKEDLSKRQQKYIYTLFNKLVWLEYFKPIK